MENELKKEISDLTLVLYDQLYSNYRNDVLEKALIEQTSQNEFQFKYKISKGNLVYEYRSGVLVRHYTSLLTTTDGILAFIQQLAFLDVCIEVVKNLGFYEVKTQNITIDLNCTNCRYNLWSFQSYLSTIANTENGIKVIKKFILHIINNFNTITSLKDIDVNTSINILAHNFKITELNV